MCVEKSTSIPALREKQLKQRLNDAWWLAVDDVPVDRPMRLRSVEEMMRNDPDAAYQILHADSAERGENEWCPVFLTPKLRSSKPEFSLPVGDNAALVERIASLEESQHTLIQTVARLSDLIERVLVDRESSGLRKPPAPKLLGRLAPDEDEDSDRDKSRGIRLVG